MFTDPFGLCPKQAATGFLCNSIEAATTFIGGIAGFLGGGGGGLLASAPTLGSAALVTVPVGAAAGAGAGVIAGKLAGEWLTNRLFSDNDGPTGGARGSDPAKGLREQLDSHRKKLAEYRSNPDAFDNKGFLKSATPELRARIIEGRIRRLEGQIKNFEDQIRQIEGGN
jgi:hypothetical protein